MGVHATTVDATNKRSRFLAGPPLESALGCVECITCRWLFFFLDGDFNTDLDVSFSWVGFYCFGCFQCMGVSFLFVNLYRYEWYVYRVLTHLSKTSR